MRTAERWWLIAGALVAGGLALADLALGRDVNFTSNYFLGAMVAAAAVRPVRTAMIGMTAVGMTLIVGVAEDIGGAELTVRMLLALAGSALAVFVARTRERGERKLTAVETVAEVAQRAILPTPPARVGSMRFAARYESAQAGARVGGDLYEIIDSEWGVRLLVGDVAGHGLPAVRVAASALGSFREMALSLRDPLDIARLLDRRLAPQLGDEGFVTAVIAEFHDDGSMLLVNCGHPWPLIVRQGVATGTAVSLAVATPPIGLGPSPTAAVVTLEPGDRLLFYTDGLIETQTRRTRGVDVEAFAPIVSNSSLEESITGVLSALKDMVDGRIEDDLALVLAEFRPG